jgi:outer membrane protein OmpA-like peptidoglycan-associated protein
MGLLKRCIPLIALVLFGMPLLAAAGRVGIGVGINVGGPGYYYGGPGYYYPGYYQPYYYGPSYYYPPPAVVYAPPEVTVQQAPAAYWYYCPAAKAYFPYVRECPYGWQAVPARASQPRTAEQQPMQAPAGKVTYSLGDVLFATGQSDLQPAATSTLDTLLASINQEPDRTIVVEGHTDSVGKASANRALSQRRADAVMQYLIAHGVAPQRITAVGKGEEHPRDSNATAAGRQHNRRVDIIVG